MQKVKGHRDANSHLMMPVFLSRYREACKLTPSPRWSPLQGPSSRSCNSVDSTGPSSRASVSLKCLVSDRSSLSSLSNFRPNRRGPRSLRYTVAATPQTWLVWSHKTTSLSGVEQWCAQELSGKRYANLTKH
jgi:hypothetical protein